MVSNWLLVLLTGLYVFVTWRTLAAIKRQADIARDQATATAKSVEALMNSERAWVFVTVENMPDLEGPPSPDRLEMLWVLPVFRNYGRTPARIKRIWASFNQLASFTAEPVYENPNANTAMDLVVPPGASVQPVPLAISTREFAAAREANVSICIYGYVDYLDISGRAFQTKFCHVYQVQSGFSPLRSGFYMGGPPAYNQAS